MVWWGNRPRERHYFRTVEWPSLAVGKEVGSVVGGSIDLGAFTDLKASGQLSYNGEEPDDVNLLQVLYEFTDTNLEDQGPFVLGTFLIEKQEVTLIPISASATRATGSVNAKSVLQVLYDDKCGLPLTVQAGADPVAEAVEIIEDHQLTIQSVPEGEFATTASETFDAQDTKAKVVNSMLSAAGFRALQPASDGSVAIVPNKLGTTPVFVFSADEHSILYPTLTETRNYASCFNCVRMHYSDENVSLYAEAKNMRGAKSSIESRGNRLKTDVIEVTELPGITVQEMLENLLQKAVDKVTEHSGVYEYVKISHDYVPLKPFDCVQVDYPDMSWVGNIANIHISISAGTRCDTEVRKYIADSIEVEARAVNIDTGDEIVWQ